MALHRHHRSCSVEKQRRQIDEMFMNQKENEVKIIESKTSRLCSIHGSHRRGSVCSVKRRESVGSMSDLSSKKRPSVVSIYNVGREEEMAKRKARLANRNSIANFGDLYSSKSWLTYDRRRESLPVLNKPVRPMEHPSDFPSMLRTTSVSTADLRRKPSMSNSRPIVTKRTSLNFDHHPFLTSTGKLHSILKNKASSPSKDSEGSSEHDLCDLTKRLSFDSSTTIGNQNRRNSNDSSSYSSYSRRISIDSLDASMRRHSRRFSDVSSIFDSSTGSTTDDGDTTDGARNGGIDLDRIRVLNNSFAESFSGTTDKLKVW